MGLSEDRLDELSREMVKGGKSVNWLARVIAYEVREQDEMLIQQMLEAMEPPMAAWAGTCVWHGPLKRAITAARARLEKEP